MIKISRIQDFKNQKVDATISQTSKIIKEIKFSEVKNSSILDDKSDDLRLVKSVKFETEHYNVANNEVLNVVEEWGFEKDKKSPDPNWKLFSIKLVS